jgi:hypothetical protein
MANLTAAREAEKEFGAELKIIKKTSPEYAALTVQPPCPSIAIDGVFIAKNDIVTFDQLRTAVQK